VNAILCARYCIPLARGGYQAGYASDNNKAYSLCPLQDPGPF
jgi:hypothetical protein